MGRQSLLLSLVYTHIYVYMCLCVANRGQRIVLAVFYSNTLCLSPLRQCVSPEPESSEFF